VQNKDLENQNDSHQDKAEYVLLRQTYQGLPGAATATLYLMQAAISSENCSFSWKLGRNSSVLATATADGSYLPIDMVANPVVQNAALQKTAVIKLRCRSQIVRYFEDIVFGSTPPLKIADATLLAKMVVGAILGRTSKRSFKAPLDRLRAVQVHILSAVVNKARKNDVSYGYRYGTLTYGSEGNKERRLR
jgi:hypothetical protein